jgi:GT2 family glycosyltransferase/glycosyltransferase involved in cell wall biosynthesis
MHRSGTSALTGVLNLHGLSLAPELMLPAADNETGFFESSKLAEAHDKFLTAIHHGYDCARSLPQDAFDSTASKYLLARISDHLGTFEGDGDLLVKDPRISRILPIWLRAAENEGLNVKLVIAVRNPLEVASSLDRRDRYSHEKSLLLWLRHMVEVEKASRDVVRTFTSFQDLISNPLRLSDQVNKAIGLGFGPRDELLDAKIDGFVSTKYRHHQFDEYTIYEDSRVLSWIQDVYPEFQRACHGDSPTLSDVVDIVSSKLDDFGDVLESVISQNDGRFANLVQQHQMASQQFEDSQSQLKIMTEKENSEKQALEAEITTYRAKISAQESKLGASSERSLSAEKAFNNALAKVASLEKTLGDSAGQFAEQLQKIGDEHRRESAAAKQAIGIAEGQVARLTEDLGKSHGELSAAAFKDGASVEKIDNQAEEIRSLRAQLDESSAAALSFEKKCKRAEASSSKASANLRQLRSERTRTQKKLETLLGEAAAKDSELSMLSTQKGLLETEVDRLNEQKWDAKGLRSELAVTVSKLKQEQKSAEQLGGKLEVTTSKLVRSRAHAKALSDELVQASADAVKLAAKIEQSSSDVAQKNEIISTLKKQNIATNNKLVIHRSNEDQTAERLIALQSRLDIIQIADVAQSASAPRENFDVMANVVEAVASRNEWLEQHIIGIQQKSKLTSALMRSGALGRFIALMTRLYSASIARNPIAAGRLAIEVELIRRSELFDQEYYLAKNWDVRVSGEDPIVHYILNGCHEGRDPSATFSTVEYLNINADVRSAGLNPLLHFIKHGIDENRTNAYRNRALGEGAREPSSDPYDVRPDDGVLPESQRGTEFMEKHGLLVDDPEYSEAVTDLNSLDMELFIPETGSGVKPIVSIIIPVYGQLAYTLNCLQSLITHKSKIACEIIVVDDCSPDKTPVYLPLVGWIRYVKQVENGGFISSCNLGAREARGDYLIFLNNDTRVLPDWLDELINSFSIFPNAGLVGSKLLYPDGSLQEAGGIFWSDGSAWNYGRNDDPNKPEYCYARQVDYVSGAAIAVRSDVWDTVGGFDGEYYDRAYCEDADLAFSIRKIGFETWYQPCSKIIHYEGKTSGTDTGSGEKAYQISNQALFFKRWAKTLSQHRMNGESPFLESDKSRQKVALVVDATTPTPDQDAGSVTVTKILQLYQRLGYRTIFVPQDNYLFQARYTRLLQRMGVCCAYAPFTVTLEDVLRQYGEDVDHALVFRIGVAEKAFDLIEKLAPNAETVFHNIDLHYLRMEREAALGGGVSQSEIQRIKTLELNMISRVDCAIVHTDVERDMVLTERPDANVKVFTYMVELEGTEVSFDDRKDIMFLGGYSHDPNVDAVKYFVSDIWPSVKEELPEAKFIIVGANPPKELIAMASKDVVVTGRVEKLRPYFDAARVFVAPLRYGAGIKGKVSTTMSFGLPSVVTPIAAEGMGLKNGIQTFVREDPKKFAKAVVELYNNQSNWQKVQQNGFQFVDRHYSMRMGQNTLADIIVSSENRMKQNAL